MITELMAGRFTAFKAGVSQIVQRATGLMSTAVAQVEPPGMELSRAGRRFVLGNSAAITGIAPATALVTTAAQWAIWNPDVVPYVFEELGVYLTSGTPGVGGTLWACIFTTPAQTGSSATGAAVGSHSAGRASSKAIVKSAVTITTPSAPTWYPVASNPSPNVAAFPSSTFLENRSLRGDLVVPPNSGLGLAVVAPAGTTPLFAPFAKWVEVEADLE